MVEEPKVAISKSKFQAIQSLMRSFCANRSKQDFLDNVVKFIHKESGCQFVGIRVLDENGFIPYQSYVGFSREFWESENMIQISKEDCSCTRLVSGALLPCDKAIINRAGSLYCNNTLAFADKLSETEKTMYRGACTNAGYLSIAIIPIVNRNSVIGIIHLADLQANQISPSTMSFVESIAPLAGEVLSRDKIEKKLKISSENKAALESIVSGISSLAYVVDIDTLEIIYSNNNLLGIHNKGLKCYKIFGYTSICPDCPKQASREDEIMPDTWERYDSINERYYYAERKTIDWPDGRIMNVAFVTDISKQKKAERDLLAANAQLERTIIELQEISASLEEEIMERQIAQEELYQKTAAIHNMAYFDSLTALPNRAYVNERLESEMKKALQGKSTGAVLFIDLDDLKTINDTYGHTYGDAVIIVAGKRIEKAVGNKAFVGRIGGDEFMAILAGERDHDRVIKIVENIIRVFNDHIEILGIRFYISASVGISIYPDDGETSEEIFKNADNAMYAAKKIGKNCWQFYEAAMQEEVYDKLHFTNHLRYALERRELAVHYQPLVRIEDGAIIGFEALLRWKNQEHGSISPERFIPLAEQSGLIQPIGKWVLKEACRFVRRLTDKGWQDIHVAVNVSPLQLSAEDFLDAVREALHSANIEPHQLELEITENVLIGPLEESTSILDQLHEMGVRLALDDFGKGYSSLTYLQCLPVDTLKIDKAFIDMILTNEMQKAIIGTIITIAHIMKMNVIAEGVETKEQLDYLAGCGCDCYQGYIMSPPVPEGEAILFLAG